MGKSSRLALILLGVCYLCRSAGSAAEEKPLRLRFITCAVDAKFFEPVKTGMRDAASLLGVEADFVGTSGVDVSAQAGMVREAVAEGVDGIALNIIDPAAFDDVVAEAMSKGVPVVAFNVDDHATPNARLSAVCQDLYAAGRSLAEHVADAIPENSRVLFTMHDEGVSALTDRLRGIQDVLKEKAISGPTIITGNDSQRGAEVIAEALRAEQGIHVVLSTGQSDTEAAGLALEKIGGTGEYWSAGFDLSPTTLRLIQAGIIRCTVDQQPYLQGFYPVVQLTQYLRYGLAPPDIDAGAAIIDSKNVDQVMELSRRNFR